MSEEEEFEARLALIVHQSGLKTKIISIRLSKEQKAMIQENADEYTNGNISEWLLIAGIDFVPWGQ